VSYPTRTELNNDVLRARISKLEEERYRLRFLLWLRHGCEITALYGDDGEMSCGKCGIDFKRFTVEQIANTWKAAARRVLDETGGEGC